ncbi:MAG TPA: hypothetical protein VGR28_07590 [Candidatus Thermoplasmatota archaeon]|jgi:hypothetical protein|nr:hypothetical protein [Candidatus Thermoplasmatota archaeon]
MIFTGSNIDVPQSIRTTFSHLLEPAISVSSAGTIYVTAHTAVQHVGRAPAFVGSGSPLRWAYLYHTDEFPGEEGQLTVDDQGHAWLFDNGAETMSLYKWCQEGAQPCGVNPDAWQSPLSYCGTALTDSPRVAWRNAKLTLVNYQGQGPGGQGYVQIGSVGENGVGPTWNACALGPGEAPGFPAMRGDGTFVVPQRQPRVNPTQIVIAKGTHPNFLSYATAFPIEETTLAGGCLPNYGWSGFSSSERLFLAAAKNQTAITIATSSDLSTFTTTTVDLPGTVSAMWLATSRTSEGALLSYAIGNGCSGADFYAAHVRVVNGTLQVQDESFVAHAQLICRDFYGSAVGPSGTAYLVVFDATVNGCNGMSDYTTRPLTVYIQDAGPTL